MFNPTVQKRIDALTALGSYLKSNDLILQEQLYQAHIHNPWFSELHLQSAIEAWADLLETENLKQWLSNYSFPESAKTRTIGLILAGNIPMVGFHDIITVLLSGHKAMIKLSSQDAKLIPHLLQVLSNIEPELKTRFAFADRLTGFDAVIATGSDNTALHFEYYFGKYPHIIRKNRNGVAVLSGNESRDELQALGKDIFLYFGMGCRNISKLYLPKNFDITKLLDALNSYNYISEHYKYNNNYDYYKSIYLINREKHYDTGFLLLKESKDLSSPLSVLYYDWYDNIPVLEKELNEHSDSIQCIASTLALKVSNQLVLPGRTQYPDLWDYADNVDTLKFLLNL